MTNGDPTLEGSRLPRIELVEADIDPAATHGFPPELLVQLQALPYALGNDTIHIAVSEPNDDLEPLLRPWTDANIALELAAPGTISRRLDEIAAARASLSSRADPNDADSNDGEAPTGPAVGLVADLLRHAAREGASDLHFVPGDRDMTVRVRVDGVVKPLAHVDEQLVPAVVGRVKVLARLDIAEHRHPQDGRFSMTIEGRPYDVRVAVLPTVVGEGAVLRLLEKTPSLQSLEQLGFTPAMAGEFDRLLDQPSWGALLVTGRTGSGKSTTLRSILDRVARPGVNVVTVEDPVEYRIRDVYQVDVSGGAGLTFPDALRGALRGDPDVIMIGEIRDADTARIALRAALAGHFVLSTLHTRNAAGALMRLTEMGVEPYVVASSLSAVLAQRLARRLCTDCREEYALDAETIRRLRLPAQHQPTEGRFFRARGCERCRDGYKGRVGIFELMTMTDRLRQLAAERASQLEIEVEASTAGSPTLWDDGLAKAAVGITSLEELRRVLV